MNEYTSLVMTQVGYANITSISNDGLKISGHLHMSPHVKFYSGYLFKSDNKKSKMIVREKAQKINCMTKKCII